MSSTSSSTAVTSGRGASKRRRPTFRPASKRKGTATKRPPSPTAVEATTPSAHEDKASPASNADQATSPSLVAKPDVVEETNSTNAVALPRVAKAPRRSGKKRKASTGVAIGSSRPSRDQAEATPGDGTLASQPAVVSEPNVPSALPGQERLQAYCSKYRSKDKRQKTKAAKPPAASVSDTPATEATVASSGPVVQVVNGEIVLQESSMVVPGARRSVQEVEEEFQHVVEEETHSAVVGASYHSFVSRRSPQHWTVEETKMFYHALRQVGMDFGTMVAYFENRTRKQLKRKYQSESSKRPHLIALALNPKSQVPLDLSVFKVKVGPSSATTRTENNEAPAQSDIPPPITVPPEIVHADMETEKNKPLAEVGGDGTPADNENELGDSETQHTSTDSIPPVAPARASSRRRSKRPKFKANKSKSRSK